MATRYDPWPEHIVEGVSDVLGETDQGLTGSEIGELLERSRIEDVAPGITKRKRLRHALVGRQAHDGAANCVIRFVTEAMEPVRYRDRPDLFSLRQDQLNEVLVFVGLRVTGAGKLARGTRAQTLPEAAKHANSLRAELRRRGVHPEVIRYCTAETLQKNAFHASLEAAKSICDRIRTMTGESGDGARLIDDTLSLGQDADPLVRINALSTVTDRDEQKGFVSLCKGILGMYRNPVAHDPRLRRQVSDDELLEMLTMISMVHRRLDSATLRTGAARPNP